MKFWLNLLISVDQLFNTIAGGNPDCTISSRIWYSANILKQFTWLRDIVDFTFKPLEVNHCENSYLSDNDTDTNPLNIHLILFALIGCIILFVPIFILSKLLAKNAQICKE